MTPGASARPGKQARRHGLGLALAIIMAGSVLPPAAAQKNNPVLLPVDEATTRPDFFSFRADLQAAIARRDVAAVLEAIHPDIKNDFGGGDGIEDFKTRWRIMDADSPLWDELGRVLALGGKFMNGEFVAPYVFSAWPDDFDSFEYIAVTGSSVRVRSAPRLDAPPLAAVSFSILKIVTGSAQAAEGWTSVELPGGSKGYIASRFVRSPIDYRAAFADSTGRWRLRFFVAGD